MSSPPPSSWSVAALKAAGAACSLSAPWRLLERLLDWRDALLPSLSVVRDKNFSQKAESSAQAPITPPEETEYGTRPGDGGGAQRQGGGGGGVARRARAARAPKPKSCATSCCGTSSTTPCAASFTCSSFTCRPPLPLGLPHKQGLQTPKERATIKKPLLIASGSPRSRIPFLASAARR